MLESRLHETVRGLVRAEKVGLEGKSRRMDYWVAQVGEVKPTCFD